MRCYFWRRGLGNLHTDSEMELANCALLSATRVNMCKRNEIASISSIASRGSKSNSTFISECKYPAADGMNVDASKTQRKGGRGKPIELV